MTKSRKAKPTPKRAKHVRSKITVEQRLAKLLEEKKYQEAEPIFDELVRSKTLEEVGYDNLISLARLKLALRKASDALQILNMAIGFDEHNTLAPEVMVEAYVQQKLYTRALEVAERLLQHDPTSVQYKMHRVIALSHMRDSETMIEAWGELLEQDPSLNASAQLSYNIINSLVADGRVDDALREWNRIKQFVKSWDPYLALVEPNLLLAQGRFDEATKSLSDSASRQPDNKIWLWNRGLIRLGYGDLEGGWKDYDKRWNWADFPSPKRDLSLRKWEGQNLHGKSLIISAEQGLGDQIMFGVAIAELLKQSPRKIRIEVQAKAVPLFQLWYPDCEISDWKNDKVIDEQLEAEFDFHVPMATVCRYLMHSVDMINHMSRRKLRLSEPEKKALLGEFYDQFPLRIGLSWRSSAIDGERVSGYMNVNLCESIIKSLPTSVGFVIVQYKFQDSERETLEKYPNVFIPKEDLFNDLVTNGKYCGACDVVVSAPTIVAQLAGLFGAQCITWSTENSWVNLGYEHPPWFGTILQIKHKPNMSKASMVARICKLLEKCLIGFNDRIKAIG